MPPPIDLLSKKDRQTARPLALLLPHGHRPKLAFESHPILSSAASRKTLWTQLRNVGSCSAFILARSTIHPCRSMTELYQVGTTPPRLIGCLKVLEKPRAFFLSQCSALWYG